MNKQGFFQDPLEGYSFQCPLRWKNVQKIISQVPTPYPTNVYEYHYSQKCASQAVKGRKFKFPDKRL
jgi:hypothetical protein